MLRDNFGLEAKIIILDDLSHGIPISWKNKKRTGKSNWEVSKKFFFLTVSRAVVTHIFQLLSKLGVKSVKTDDVYTFDRDAFVTHPFALLLCISNYEQVITS